MGLKRHTNHPEAGQALIEFVLGLMIVIAFFFFYVKMAAVFALGNYLHYATFMAARANMASAADKAAQQANGELVLEKMVGGRFKLLIKPDGGSSSVPGGMVGDGPYFNEDPAADSWNSGAVFSYIADLSLYPWSRGGDKIELKLASESWLRREPSEAEVLATFNQLQQKTQLPKMMMEWDNGF